MKKIAICNLPNLFRSLAADQDLFVPVKTAGQTNFGLWTEEVEVDLKTLKTVKSGKDMFLRIEVGTVSEQKKAATGVRGMKLDKNDSLTAIYLLPPGTNQEVEVKGKKYDLNRLHIGNRDTKGTKK